MDIFKLAPHICQLGPLSGIIHDPPAVDLLAAPLLEKFETDPNIMDEYERLKSYDSRTYVDELDSPVAEEPCVMVPELSTVHYDSFGKVVLTKLSSERYGVKISGLPFDSSRYGIASTISEINGREVPESSIQYRRQYVGDSFAIALVNDTAFAQVAIEKFEALSTEDAAKMNDVCITPLTKKWRRDITEYHMSLSTVKIIWQKVSNATTLFYFGNDRDKRAEKAEDLLRDQVIQGRAPELLRYSGALFGEPVCIPDDTNLHQSSIEYSDSETALSPLRRLRSRGSLTTEISFRYFSFPDSEIVKAVATYINPNDAAEITTDLQHFAANNGGTDLPFSISHFPDIR